MQVKLLKIFIASPGDVSKEREVVREVIDDLNRSLAQEKGAVLQAVGWETDARPSFGSDPQSLVNNQIADMAQYDLFVGILWDRFGTATPRAGSGTEEEFKRAVEENRRRGQPEIMFYFCQRPTAFTTADQALQKGKVLEFRGRLQNQGLSCDYREVEDFRRLVTKHLMLWVRNLGAETPTVPPERRRRRDDAPKGPKKRGAGAAAASSEAGPVSDSGAWLLLNNAFYKSKAVSERNDGTVEIQIAPVNAEEDAALRALRPDRAGHVEPVPFAYKNDGFIARILSAELRSLAGKSIWVMSLKPDKDLRSFTATEISSVNGVSADKIANRRARLILLNESPPSRGTITDRLESIISGLTSDIRVTEGIFPKLWSSFKGRSQVFLPAARLWAVFMLKASGTCEQVLDLTLGPINGDRMVVRFRGRRQKRFSNAEPATLEVDGTCELGR